MREIDYQGYKRKNSATKETQGNLELNTTRNRVLKGNKSTEKQKQNKRKEYT